MDKFFDKLNEFWEKKDKRPEAIRERDAFMYKALIYSQSVKSKEKKENRDKILKLYEPKKIFRNIKMKNGNVYINTFEFPEIEHPEHILAIVGMKNGNLVECKKEEFEEIKKR